MEKGATVEDLLKCLKKELVAKCRYHNISVSGTKLQLAERIVKHHRSDQNRYNATKSEVILKQIPESVGRQTAVIASTSIIQAFLIAGFVIVFVLGNFTGLVDYIEGFDNFEHGLEDTSQFSFKGLDRSPRIIAHLIHITLCNASLFFLYFMGGTRSTLSNAYIKLLFVHSMSSCFCIAELWSIFYLFQIVKGICWYHIGMVLYLKNHGRISKDKFPGCMQSALSQLNKVAEQMNEYTIKSKQFPILYICYHPIAILFIVGVTSCTGFTTLSIRFPWEFGVNNPSAYNVALALCFIWCLPPGLMYFLGMVMEFLSYSSFENEVGLVGVFCGMLLELAPFYSNLATLRPFITIFENGYHHVATMPAMLDLDEEDEVFFSDGESDNNENNWDEAIAFVNECGGDNLGKDDLDAIRELLKNQDGNGIKRSKKNERSYRRYYAGLYAFLVFVALLMLQSFASYVHTSLSSTSGNICSHLEKCNCALSIEQEKLCMVGDEIDANTRLFYNLFSIMAGVKEEDKNNIQPEEGEYASLKKTRVSSGIWVPIVRWGKSWTKRLQTLVSMLALKYLQDASSWPMVDINTTWKDFVKGKLGKNEDTWSTTDWQDILKISGGRMLPPFLGINTELDVASDDAITYFSFSGLAAHAVEAVTGEEKSLTNATYKVDFDWMYRFDVRFPFEKYGAIAYFDDELRPLNIYWSHKQKSVYPHDEDWNHAKWVFKCSVLTGVTLKDHLLGLHLLLSNFVNTANHENLGKNHPIRRMLTPFTYNNIEINQGAITTLLPSHSLFHRASALSAKGIHEAFQMGYEVNHIFEPIRSLARHDRLDADGNIKKRNGKLLPFEEDMVEFWKVVNEFVRGYVSVYYQNDDDIRNDSELISFFENLKQPYFRDSTKILKQDGSPLDVCVKFFTNFIFGVTGFHNHVGSVAEYLTNPMYAGAKIRENSEISDIQASVQALNVGLITGAKVPILVHDYSHVVLDDDKKAETKALFRSFAKELDFLSEEVERRNKVRGLLSCNSFNPKYMPTAISV